MQFMRPYDLRIEAEISKSQLARDAHVSEQTITRLENGEVIRPYLAQRVVRVLSGYLGRPIALGDLDQYKPHSA